MNGEAYLEGALRCVSCNCVLFMTIERRSPLVYRVSCGSHSCPEYSDEYLYEVPKVALKPGGTGS